MHLAILVFGTNYVKVNLQRQLLWGKTEEQQVKIKNKKEKKKGKEKKGKEKKGKEKKGSLEKNHWSL